MLRKYTVEAVLLTFVTERPDSFDSQYTVHKHVAPYVVNNSDNCSGALPLLLFSLVDRLLTISKLLCVQFDSDVAEPTSLIWFCYLPAYSVSMRCTSSLLPKKMGFLHSIALQPSAQAVSMAVNLPKGCSCSVT